MEDVEKFPGHIACSSLSKSEIVIPIYHPKDKSKVVGVLDIDSEFLACFDQTDAEYLNRVCELVSFSSEI